VTRESAPPLSSPFGDLVSLKINVDPRALEDLLEALAELPFPVNPQIHQQPVAVEFPAYRSWIADVRTALVRAGFGSGEIEVRPALVEVGGN
jgi:hypothetical protein